MKTLNNDYRSCLIKLEQLIKEQQSEEYSKGGLIEFYQQQYQKITKLIYDIDIINMAKENIQMELLKNPLDEERLHVLRKEYISVLSNKIEGNKVYSEKQLVSFGNYLLSDERMKNTHSDIEVTDADLVNWKEKEKDVYKN